MRLLCLLFSLGVLAQGQSTQARPARRATLLDIPARKQAPESPKEGWCAETAIQEAMIYFGKRISQRRINHAGRPSHPDLYWSDLPRALAQLGFKFRRWSGPRGQKAFVAWVKKQLRAGKPVLAGVKLLPTRHPQWGLDHIVLIVGFDDAALHINTTWGTRQRRTLAELAGQKGISFRNRSGRFFAFALEGLGKGP
jgi:hypothetical protein